MIAVDTNLLVYAHREDCPFHDAALASVTALAQGGAPWAVPWPCVHEFVAITTHPSIYTPPSPLDLAIEAVRVWIESPSCRTIGEGPGYLDTLRAQAVGGKVAGAMIHDARIAAICLHNGVGELWSADRDFSRYGDLRVVNPLV